MSLTSLNLEKYRKDQNNIHTHIHVHIVHRQTVLPPPTHSPHPSPSMSVPLKTTNRSPLRETDANLKPQSALGPRACPESHATAAAAPSTKKRALDRLEHSLVKQQRVKRTRSIEGAVLLNKPAGKPVAARAQALQPKELVEWQNNWLRILKRDTRIFFDVREDKKSGRLRHKLEEKRELLVAGFELLGAEISPFYDNRTTIVITTRSAEDIAQEMDSNDILVRARKNSIKVWGFEKAFRFLSNLNVEIDTFRLEDPQFKKLDSPDITAQTHLARASKTGTLSTLLKNEKIFGSNDRDPRTRRDDIHYFKYPHVYMYDLWQTWAPIITLEWKPQELADVEHLPYPTLKMGTFGRCPFIGDKLCDERSEKRVIKRYSRDQENRKHATELHIWYQHHAQPDFHNMHVPTMTIPHICNDSRYMYLQFPPHFEDLFGKINDDKSVMEEEALSTSTHSDNTAAADAEKHAATWREPATPQLKHAKLARQETEEFPDDLCNSFKKHSQVPFEIKASGVHQSNDVATSFGNGLGPTKASVTSKKIKTLNRLVVDRKLVSKTPSQANKTRHSSHKDVPAGSNLKISSNASSKLAPPAQVPAPAPTKMRAAKPAKRPVVRNPGYCENCRVKYEALEEHILSDKHLAFAENGLNFECIDSLIDKLKFQF
ncbi:protein serine/threonine kinase activating protein DBF4 KNAG_0H01060 [Huiozyma naganishii CBS 8797]|uniref:DBF4-type domain-containing protein n=1 Tax=Huiozyma naganishii (strain ATCC MYA-139 / BCRC 22969 / CBS 8797 / KCTC 17520 / NBRC 10181 / NCYC 3082 / Yp74L-3) TaxID=1071383 RepID=J7S8G4_HUIN7|nr:hypothetical protein KNAG_0H01060 [Kazachstania naganishii CBS 8797]CCK71519.1 hypothetical protein KNAG_0H01060 [Kazachstania naganishii CBS 8797]